MVPAELDEEDQADISNIAELLRNTDLRADLRGAASSKELYDSLCD
jgi:mannitol/fructose-specific phosphotransferase system IIA component (Ntr-type)